MLRSRVAYAALALVTIAAGLGVHFRGDALTPASRDVLGDAIWAAMIVWWLSVIVPSASIRNRGLAALAICFAVELSQRYHTPALDALRSTAVGHMTLGSGFDPRDFMSYSLGVLVASLLEWTLRPWLLRRHSP